MDPVVLTSESIEQDENNSQSERLAIQGGGNYEVPEVRCRDA